ncbi:hypothetical protein PFHG_05156 [Plasmodium falciparum HB3]|uniref:Rifin n=1 Tax=Plasmodium falciparum (isolate HB3) TaxID=137071 RepID=A0A0L7KKK5_PLAFX|nr:hypothetical protein PFHG_05156 [Plasmodium falciparum HB3]
MKIMRKKKNYHYNLLCTLKAPHIIHLKIPTARLLCECELYAPTNYDNDPEMKSKYNERLLENKQKCKEQCDKEIQKIILKDKLEKQMEQQLTTLETKIDTNDIPTCICEKSLEDKMEKVCLRCGYGLGTVAPTVGLIGSVAINVWKPAALKVAIEKAITAGTDKIAAAANAAGLEAGKEVVITSLKFYRIDELCPGLFNSIGTTTRYNETSKIIKVILEQHGMKCGLKETDATRIMCTDIGNNFNIIRNDTGNFFTTKDGITNAINEINREATQAANIAAEAAGKGVAAEITTEQTTAINTIFMGKQTAIIASIVAIVVIILIMVIIYLILRYRRKKKIKKKLQYIKLLEE